MDEKSMQEALARLHAGPTITAYDCARLLNVSPQHVYAQVESGDIPATRIGTTVRVLSAPLRARLGLEVAQ